MFLEQSYYVNTIFFAALIFFIRTLNNDNTFLNYVLGHYFVYLKKIHFSSILNIFICIVSTNKEYCFQKVLYCYNHNNNNMHCMFNYNI